MSSFKCILCFILNLVVIVCAYDCNDIRYVSKVYEREGTGYVTRLDMTLEEKSCLTWSSDHDARRVEVIDVQPEYRFRKIGYTYEALRMRTRCDTRCSGLYTKWFYDECKPGPYHVEAKSGRGYMRAGCATYLNYKCRVCFEASPDQLCTVRKLIPGDTLSLVFRYMGEVHTQGITRVFTQFPFGSARFLHSTVDTLYEKDCNGTKRYYKQNFADSLIVLDNLMHVAEGFKSQVERYKSCDYSFDQEYNAQRCDNVHHGEYGGTIRPDYTEVNITHQLRAEIKIAGVINKFQQCKQFSLYPPLKLKYQEHVVNEMQVRYSTEHHPCYAAIPSDVAVNSRGSSLRFHGGVFDLQLPGGFVALRYEVSSPGAFELHLPNSDVVIVQVDFLSWYEWFREKGVGKWLRSIGFEYSPELVVLVLFLVIYLVFATIFYGRLGLILTAILGLIVLIAYYELA